MGCGGRPRRPASSFFKQLNLIITLNYSEITTEALAPIWALHHFEVEEVPPLVVYTDHNPVKAEGNDMGFVLISRMSKRYK